MDLPKLTIHEIEKFFKENCPSLGVTKAALQKPQEATETLALMYQYLLVVAYDADASVFEQMPFNANFDGGLMEPDLFAAGYAKIMLCSSLFTLLDMICPNANITFGIDDLMNPIPGKTIRFLSILIDYVTMAQKTNAVVVTPLLNEIEEQKFTQDQLRQDIDELKQQVNETKLKKQTEKERARSVQAEVNEIGTEIRNLVLKSEEHNAEGDKLNNELNRKEELLVELKTDIDRKQTETANLDLYIVKSPYRLTEALDNVKSQRQQLMREITELREQLDELKKRQQVLGSVVITKLDILQGEVNEIETTQKSLTEQRTILDDNRQCIVTARQKIDDAQRDIERSRQLLETKSAQFDKSRIKSEQKIRDVNENIRKYQDRISQMNDARQQNVVAADDLEHECEQMRSEMQQMRNEHTDMIKRFEQQYDMLNQTLESQIESNREWYLQVLGRGSQSENTMIT